MKKYKRCLTGVLLVVLIKPDTLLAKANYSPGAPLIWQRHTIDNSSLGSDGTKFADVNRDGKIDLISGWSIRFNSFI